MDCETHNPLIDNLHLQMAFDTYLANEVKRLEEEQEFISDSNLFISTMIKELNHLTENLKNDEDSVDIPWEVVNRLRKFRDDLWPRISNNGEASVAASDPLSSKIYSKIFKHPSTDKRGFPGNISLSRSELSYLISGFHIILDYQQNKLSTLVRKLKELMDSGVHCTTMTAERAKSNPNKTFILNQLTRR